MVPCLISSIYDLDLVLPFKFQMLLSWALTNEKYRNFYKKLKADLPDKFFILDNGANENKLDISQVGSANYITNALDLKVNEIQAPDVYQDCDSTIEQTTKFIDENYLFLKEHNISIMAIPQGKTLEELLHCWETFCDNPKIDTIGIGYRNILDAIKDELLDMTLDDWKEIGLYKDNIKYIRQNVAPEAFLYTMSRIYFLRKKVNIGKLINKKIHLLGLYNPVELSLYASPCFSTDELSLFRSCDSAAPIEAAQSYTRFQDYGVKDKPQKFLNMYEPLGTGQRKIAEYNIDWMKVWLR